MSGHNSNLKLLSLNVCGLKSKLIIPEFKDLLSDHDIIGFQETKLDFVDEEQFCHGFYMFYKSRHKVSKDKSGGLAIAVKNSIAKYISILETASKLVLWFKISNKLTGYSDDTLGGLVYIPPEQTRYSVDEIPFLK